ncbi:hypothetical protein JTM00_35385, partial [Pseudomonas aeruginosa]|nr:hypothetical protein [Pseudomonas aeruginosa]
PQDAERPDERWGHRSTGNAGQGMAAPSCVANAAAKRVVTALRSDEPRHTPNNAGKSQFLLRAAYMMMAALH